MNLTDLPPHLQKHLSFARTWVGPEEDTVQHMFVLYDDDTMDLFALMGDGTFETSIQKIMLDEDKISKVKQVTLLSEGWSQRLEAPKDEPDPQGWIRGEFRRRVELWGKNWSTWPEAAQKEHLQDTLRIDSALREEYWHVAIPIEREDGSVKLREDKAIVEKNPYIGGRIGSGLRLVFKSQQIHDTIYGVRR